jgi:hypothetical protein
VVTSLRRGGRQMQVAEEVSGQPEDATQLETQEENWKLVFVEGVLGGSWARAVGRAAPRRRDPRSREGGGRGCIVEVGGGGGGGESSLVDDDDDTRDGPRRMGFGKRACWWW